MIALLAQAGLVLLIFGLPQARILLDGVNAGVAALADSTQAGSSFVFGYLAGAGQPYVPAAGSACAVPVRLPCAAGDPGDLRALGAALALEASSSGSRAASASLFQKTLGMRGPPALATAATVFMGQVEGPIFIRSYLPQLTRSELFLLMAVGMSCVSGSTMVAYATILANALPNAGAHVLTASVISAPAGVLLARILVPPGRKRRGSAHGCGGGQGLRLHRRRGDQGHHRRPAGGVERGRQPDRVRGAHRPGRQAARHVPAINGAPISIERGSASCSRRWPGRSACPGMRRPRAGGSWA